MDRSGTLKIVRGCSSRDVARAGGNSNIRSRASRQNNNGRSRIRGQAGVAVRKDDDNNPLEAFDSGHNNDHENESPRNRSQPPLDAKDYGTAVDLARDSPETTVGSLLREVDREGSSTGGRSTPSLGAWLQPVPPPKAAAAKGSSRRRKRPSQDAARTWAATSSRRQGSGMPGAGRAGGDGSLEAWLEPRQPAASQERRNTPGSRTFDSKTGHGSGGDSDSDDDDDDDDDYGRWMSDRLEGLDPNGAARAKDSWTDRERRNLTSTDVALGAKRKSRGGGRRGWKTKAGGSRVFVAPGRGSGAAVPSGLFKGDGGGDGRKKRKR
eukprot:g3588.t1